MDFNFIPFNLGADIAEFKDDIQYISSDNGVDLYKAREGLKMPILGIPISDVNLYFFEGNLITIYIHLGDNPKNIEKVKQILENAINSQGRALKSGSSKGLGWFSGTEFLGLILSEKGKKLYLYYSLREYSVF